MSPASRHIACHASDGFNQWMSDAGGTLAISTYQAGKLVLAGWNGRQVTVMPRDFQKPLGLAVDGDRLALACRHQVIIFANADMLPPTTPNCTPGNTTRCFSRTPSTKQVT